MNKLFKLLFLVFLPLFSFAQLRDDFSDGDFTTNPPWTGDGSQFRVNAGGQLQLNGTAAGSSFLSTSLNLPSLNGIEWQFFIRLNFSPSSNNYGRVYLASDQQNLNGALNGYYLQFGESLSNDAVELFRQTGTVSTSVCRGTNAEITNSFSVRVKVVRDHSAQWTLYVDAAGGTNYNEEATAIDSTYTTSAYFGVVCAYTSSNVTNFYFDDFYAGPDMPDPAPQPINSGDLVINEVLFSTNSDGAEFVELYNRSSIPINLNEVTIAKRDLKTLQIKSSAIVGASSGVILPQSYLLLTTNPGAVKSQYYSPYPNAFLQMSLPDLLTNEDIIVLQDKFGAVIDELHYHSSWHFPLLNDVHGVSLERLNPLRQSNDSTNWHSAAESVGFATPGYRNSQASEAGNANEEIAVDPEVFSPDNDGIDDVVNLRFHFNATGYVANVDVFDSKGRHVRTVASNELIGNEGMFSWDGINEKKEKARTGIYIFYIQVFDVKGNVKDFKKTCVLATRL